MTCDIAVGTVHNRDFMTGLLLLYNPIEMNIVVKTELLFGYFQAKLRKATIGFVMSVRPHRITRLCGTEFSEI